MLGNKRQAHSLVVLAAESVCICMAVNGMVNILTEIIILINRTEDAWLNGP